jgi:segregation and condensation protein B
MLESMSEPASTATPAINQSVVESVNDVFTEAKPKPPRKPRVKTEAVAFVVRERKQVARFPHNWAKDEHWKIVVKPGMLLKPERKPAPRLPAAWSLRIRASRHRSIVFERPIVLPEPSKECDVNTKRIVEAILFAANRPMTIKQIQETFPELEQPDTLTVQTALEDIARDYADRPVGLKQLASGYRFQVREGLSHWVTRLFEEKPARYSRALLETLAIIAYRQPVTRGEIEDIRGVSVSTSIIQTMLEREWIRVIGHKEVPGRPALYSTTKEFLDYFNLTSLNDLPTLQEIVDMDFGAGLQQTPQQEPRERSQTATAQTADDQLESTQSQAEASGTYETADADDDPRILH